VALEGIGEVDPGEIGMSDKIDTEHLRGLPLMPVGTAVDVGKRIERRIILRNLSRKHDRLPVLDVAETAENLVARFDVIGFGGIADHHIGGPVDGRQP
jgi:hypothetical protein